MLQFRIFLYYAVNFATCTVHLFVRALYQLSYIVLQYSVNVKSQV